MDLKLLFHCTQHDIEGYQTSAIELTVLGENDELVVFSSSVQWLESLRHKKTQFRSAKNVWHLVAQCLPLWTYTLHMCYRNLFVALPIYFHRCRKLPGTLVYLSVGIHHYCSLIHDLSSALPLLLHHSYFFPPAASFLLFASRSFYVLYFSYFFALRFLSL